MNLIQAIRAVLREMEGKQNEAPIPQLPQMLQVPANVQPVAVEKNPPEELPPEILKLPVLPQVPPNVLNNALEQNKDVMWRYLYRVVEKAVKEDAPEVNLWRVDGTRLVLFLRREQYTGCLERMIEHFIQTEQYEYAPFCYELLDKIKVNDVVRQSR